MKITIEIKGKYCVDENSEMCPYFTYPNKTIGKFCKYSAFGRKELKSEGCDILRCPECLELDKKEE
jgi:hypothetical protein